MPNATQGSFAYQLRNIRRIKVVELKGRRSDRVKDAILPWHGTVLVACLLEQEGYEVEALVENVAPFPLEDAADADALLVHVTAGNIRETKQLIDEVKAIRDIPCIAGGALAKVVPSVVAEICDFVVRGEGEDSIVELLQALRDGRDLHEVQGVSWWQGVELQHNPARKFTARLDVPTRMSIIRNYRAVPMMEQLRSGRFPLMTVEASRGCPFACKFCITPDLYGSYRPRTVDTVISDIRDRLQYSNRIWFIDNLFAVKRAFVVELLERMIAEGLHQPGNYTCFLRVENSEDTELLQLMRRAGIVNAYVGFESIDDSTQRSWNKVIKLRRMADCVGAFHEAGIRVNGSFLAGADTQRLEDIDATVDWCIENKLDYLGLYCLTPIQMAENACVDRRRMLAPSWDYMDGEHVTYFPMHMRPSALQESVRKNLMRFYDPRRVPAQMRSVGKLANPWAFPASLLALWNMVRKASDEMSDYVGYLRSVEAPYYQGQELIEDRLPPQGLTTLPWIDTIDSAVRVIRPRSSEPRAGKFTAAICNEDTEAAG